MNLRATVRLSDIRMFMQGVKTYTSEGLHLHRERREVMLLKVPFNISYVLLYLPDIIFDTALPEASRIDDSPLTRL